MLILHKHDINNTPMAIFIQLKLDSWGQKNSSELKQKGWLIC